MQLPVSVAESVEVKGVWCHPDEIKWLPGFSPVSESLFSEAKETEASWKFACAGMELSADDQADDIWTMTDKLGLARLNSPQYTVPEYAIEKTAGLRSSYPELAMLSDGTLWSMYDTYQMEYWHMSSWEPGREEDFIFFLIGNIADSRGEMSNAIALWKGCLLLDARKPVGRFPTFRGTGALQQNIGGTDCVPNCRGDDLSRARRSRDGFTRPENFRV
jgi:hypothetical protein